MLVIANSHSCRPGKEATNGTATSDPALKWLGMRAWLTWMYMLSSVLTASVRFRPDHQFVVSGVIRSMYSMRKSCKFAIYTAGSRFSDG